MVSAESIKSYESIFNVNQQSVELFGLGKKKEPKQSDMSIEEIRKLPKYNKQLFEKCAKLFINAWNWKAYKLPTSLGKNSDGKQADPNYDGGFKDNIVPMDKKYELKYNERMSDGKIIILSEGIYEFAYGELESFDLYYKIQDDICSRWKKRLEEKVPVVEKMLEEYPGVKVTVDCDEGDGDEGCVYPTYCIEIPINSMK